MPTSLRVINRYGEPYELAGRPIKPGQLHAIAGATITRTLAVRNRFAVFPDAHAHLSANRHEQGGQCTYYLGRIIRHKGRKYKCRRATGNIRDRGRRIAEGSSPTHRGDL